MMRRVCIYQIHQKSASASGYIRQTIAAMQSCCTKIIAVADADWDAPIPGVRFVRSLQSAFSLPVLAKADEVLLLGDSWMGPVRELEPMLAAADDMCCDCWQLARNAPFWGLRPKAARHHAVLDWTRQPTESLQSIISQTRLTCAVVYDSEKLRTLTENPMLDEPKYMTETMGCPFFLHEIFYRDYDQVVFNTLGHMAQNYYRYLTKTLMWNTDPMWDFLLATCHMEDLYRNLHLTYVLSTRLSNRDAIRQHLQTYPLALMMHLFYEDLIPESLEYAKNFPQQTHIYITTDSQRKAAKIKRAFASLKAAKLKVSVIPNRGRDVSSLLVGMKDAVDDYEYVCSYHDKKVLQTKPGSVGIGFADKIHENLMANQDFIYNVIQTFMDHPRLGLLAPPPPHHADYFFTLGICWGVNYTGARYLRDSLGIRVPMAENKQPIAPLGTSFWFRKGALASLYGAEWTYENFPSEPLDKDGTMLHMVERLYPYAAQDAGFYSAYLLSDRYAPIEYTSLHHYVRGFHKVFFQNGIFSYHSYMRDMLSQRLHAPARLRTLTGITLRRIRKRIRGKHG